MQGNKILVIDDDPNVLGLLERIFFTAGAQVFMAASGREGLRQFYSHQPDLIILDVMMPDLDGWQVCARIREVSKVPIIFLTALGAEQDIVRGLDCGGIDYVVKPFSTKVLLARARAALRRSELDAGPKKPAAYRDDYLTVDLDQRQVLVRGEAVKLSATEHQLLAYLVRNAGRVRTFRQILEHVWGWEYQDNVNYLHTYVWRLRKKLEADPKNPCYLLSEHKVGYRFESRPPPQTNGRQGAPD